MDRQGAAEDIGQIIGGVPVQRGGKANNGRVGAYSSESGGEFQCYAVNESSGIRHPAAQPRARVILKGLM
jgi:hypothetical protein